MTIDKKYIDQFINVTSNAAIASYHLVGKKDKIAADQAAVDAMRTELNKINMTGEIVIGEGSLDEAPMLFTGEILGKKSGPEFDIAVDPLEGTNFAANNLPGALSVIAVAEKGNLFKAPETYMHKIATAKVEKGLIDLDFSIQKNIENLAEYKNTTPSNLTACILDRPRHKKIIDDLSKLKVQIKLITDGDVAGALHFILFLLFDDTNKFKIEICNNKDMLPALVTFKSLNDNNKSIEKRRIRFDYLKN